MDAFHPTQASLSPYKLLFRALSSIPISHYFLASLFCSLIFLYHFLEFHFLEDVFSGLRGSPVSLTFNSHSQIYEGVVSKCKILHGRYLATPWLSSPHFQTAFLNFFGRPPVFNYRRQIFRASDGGSLALDWLLPSDVLRGAFHANNAISKDDTTPIVVVIPGLTSDSTSAYIKHFAFNMVKRGWNIVVSNHRGLGGISITSDCFYNAGWTEDIREVIAHLHHEYPVAPLFAVGTSIGANILVKYLGEDGENIPVAGAVAICNPWDLLIGDRFISRRLLQKFYDMALASGLQGYAQLHQPRYSRLADWEGIKKSRSIRDFDTYATCLVGKFETADTYYRRCSSASFVGNVAVPLLCVSALDDPVCTREAIPWDECRANKNVILATPQHGGHLAFFEGIAATSLWWVRAVDEFLSVLHLSPFMHKQKKILNSGPHSSLESAIDQGPYVNFAEDGMVAAMGNEQTSTVVGPLSEGQNIHDKSSDNEMASDSEQDERMTTENSALAPNTAQTSKLAAKPSSIRKCLEKLSQHNRISMWLMGYIAITTSWPLVGPALQFVFKNKFKSVLPAALHGR
ncbi:embryogenesis-associated protein EMB8-like [Vitis riparia]|uniref:embryogenesis-associated protein EMB8-like n=1 Tax=Vitis riparia TaxID=96939 RepID=UPI00155A95FE|nr:embryogenesis-associated protein EMB8-like [Vitis riparia]